MCSCFYIPIRIIRSIIFMVTLLYGTFKMGCCMSKGSKTRNPQPSQGSGSSTHVPKKNTGASQTNSVEKRSTKTKVGRFSINNKKGKQETSLAAHATKANTLWHDPECSPGAVRRLANYDKTNFSDAVAKGYVVTTESDVHGMPPEYSRVPQNKVPAHNNLPRFPNEYEGILHMDPEKISPSPNAHTSAVVAASATHPSRSRANENEDALPLNPENLQKRNTHDSVNRQPGPLQLYDSRPQPCPQSRDGRRGFSRSVPNETTHIKESNTKLFTSSWAAEPQLESPYSELRKQSFRIAHEVEKYVDKASFQPVNRPSVQVLQNEQGFRPTHRLGSWSQECKSSTGNGGYSRTGNRADQGPGPKVVDQFQGEYKNEQDMRCKPDKRSEADLVRQNQYSKPERRNADHGSVDAGGQKQQSRKTKQTQHQAHEGHSPGAGGQFYGQHKNQGNVSFAADTKREADLVPPTEGTKNQDSKQERRHANPSPKAQRGVSNKLDRQNPQPMDVDFQKPQDGRGREHLGPSPGQKRRAPEQLRDQQVKRASVELKKEPRTDEILEALRSKQKAKYADPNYSTQDRSFWLDLRWRNERGETEGKLCALSELLPPPGKWRMLVYGKPLFGKTTLCRSLVSSWALGDRQTGGFHIVYGMSLDATSAKDIERTILKNCCQDLGSKICSEDELREAWREAMSSTLLILDGYDRLAYDDKLKVRSFVASNKYFGQGCVLMTCRPEGREELGHLFNLQADICGLGEETLTKELATGSTSSDDLKAFIQDSKVREMYGVSPAFADAIASVIIQNQRPQSLYELLDAVMNQTARKEGVCEDALHQVGMFLFARLKERKFHFDQKSLAVLFKDKAELRHLRGMNLFVNSHENSTIIHVSHLNLMVYLAVKYLRKEWVKLGTDRQRIVFLSENLCFKDCSEEYITDNSNPPKRYYAGQIPEIVFDYSTGHFQMTEDVSCQAVKSAFETASLLFRVDPGRLPSYGIIEEEGLHIENSFEVILNMLAFDYLTVYSKFYTCHGSYLRFVKFAAVDEDHEKVVMMCVSSVDPLHENAIRDVFLDFQESAVPQIYPFLCQLTSRFLRSSSLDENMRGPELVHSLIFSALDSKRNLFMRFTLGSSSLDHSRLVTCEVISSRDGNSSVSLSYTGNDGKGERPMTKIYDSEECKHLCRDTNRKKLLERLKSIVDEVQDNTVTIRIKTHRVPQSNTHHQSSRQPATQQLASALK